MTTSVPYCEFTRESTRTRRRPTLAEAAQARQMLDQQLRFRTEQLIELDRQLVRPGAARSTADQEIRDSLATGARAALRDVRDALSRMANGRYGLCTSCGEPVEPARLEILPQAAVCLGCRPAHA